MNAKEFERVMQSAIAQMRSLSSTKCEEYSSEADRLENFRDAAALDYSTEEQALWGMVLKHIVSIAKFFREARSGKIRTASQWREKWGDIRMYSVLHEAMLVDRDAQPRVLSLYPATGVKPSGDNADEVKDWEIGHRRGGADPCGYMNIDIPCEGPDRP